MSDPFAHLVAEDEADFTPARVPSTARIRRFGRLTYATLALSAIVLAGRGLYDGRPWLTAQWSSFQHWMEFQGAVSDLRSSNPTLAKRGALWLLREGGEAGFTALRQAMRADDVEARRNAYRAGIEAGGEWHVLSHQGWVIADAGSRDNDPIIRRMAVKSLVQHDAFYPYAATSLVRVLRDPDPTIRRLAARSLGDHASSSAPVMKAAMRDDDRSIRVLAASIVISNPRTYDSEAIWILRRAISDPAPSAGPDRDLAASALIAHSDHLEPHELMDALVVSFPVERHDRLRTIRLLWGLAAEFERAARALTRFREDGDFVVRQMTAIALADLDSKRRGPDASLVLLFDAPAFPKPVRRMIERSIRERPRERTIWDSPLTKSWPQLVEALEALADDPSLGSPTPEATGAAPGPGV